MSRASLVHSGSAVFAVCQKTRVQLQSVERPMHIAHHEMHGGDMLNFTSEPQMWLVLCHMSAISTVYCIKWSAYSLHQKQHIHGYAAKS